MCLPAPLDGVTMPRGHLLRVKHLGGPRRALAWSDPLVTLLALSVAVLAGLLLIRLSPLQGLVTMGAAAVFVTTLIEPVVGLSTALFLGPLKAYLAAELPQIPAQVAHGFVALTLAAWLARGLARRILRIPCSPLLVPLLTFFGAALFSLWDAVDVPTGVLELIKWVQIVALFVFVSHHLKSGRLPWVLGALLVTGLFQASVGIWQFGLRGEGPEHFAILGGDFYRAYGTFEQPNPYAGYLGMTAALALGVVAGAMRDKLVDWYAGKLGRRCATQESTNPSIFRSISLSTCLLGGSAAVGMLAALAMSWSRGAWLGFGAAVLAMAAALPRQTRWGLLLVVVLVVAAIGLHATGLLPASFTARLTSFVQDIRLQDVRGVPINDANYAVVERLAHWQAGLAMFRHNLWTGVGLGCYEPAYPRFALINWPMALGHAHNYYLNLAAETGLIGLLAYLALWGTVLWQTWRVTRRASGLARGIGIGLLGAWTHLSVHHFLDNLYVNNVHLHIGVLLGLLAFVIRRTNRRACPERSRRAGE